MEYVELNTHEVLRKALQLFITAIKDRKDGTHRMVKKESCYGSRPSASFQEL